MADLTADNGDFLTSDTGDQLVDAYVLYADAATFAAGIGSAALSYSGDTDGALVTDDGVTVLTADNGDTLVVDAAEGTLTDDVGNWLSADNGDILVVPETSGQNYVIYPATATYAHTGYDALVYDRLFVRNVVVASFNLLAPSPAGLAAAHLLITDAASYALTGYQMSPITAAKRMAADSAQFVVSSVGAELSGDNFLTASQATFTMTGQAVSFRSGRHVDIDAGAYVLTGGNAGLKSYTIEAWKHDIALTGSNVAFIYSGLDTKSGGDDAPIYNERERNQRWRKQAKDRDRLRALLEGREYVDPDEDAAEPPNQFVPQPLPPEVIPPVRQIQINPAQLRAALEPFIQQQRQQIAAQQNRVAAEMLLF
jgi:hypothetical protein